MADPTSGKGTDDTAMPMQTHGPAASVDSVLTQLAEFLDQTAMPTDPTRKALFTNTQGALDGWRDQLAAQEWNGLSQSVGNLLGQISATSEYGGLVADQKLVGQLQQLLLALRNAARAAAEEASQSD